jgi:hypothetical protein
MTLSAPMHVWAWALLPAAINTSTHSIEHRFVLTVVMISVMTTGMAGISTGMTIAVTVAGTSTATGVSTATAAKCPAEKTPPIPGGVFSARGAWFYAVAAGRL